MPKLESKKKKKMQWFKQVKKVNFKNDEIKRGAQYEEHLPRTSIKQIIEFPIIELSKFEVKGEDYRLNTKIPDIKTKKREIKTPIIKFNQKPTIIQNLSDFNFKLPNTPHKNREVKIPIITLPSFNKTEIQIPYFKTNTPNISFKKRENKVPIYSIYNREILSSKYKFNILIDPVFMEHLQTQILEETEKIWKSKKISKNTSSPENLKPPNMTLDDGFIEDDIPEEIVGLTSAQFSKRPVVIFLKDPDNSYTPIIEIFCQKIYREIEGGFAEPKRITNHEDFKEIIEFWLKAEKMIFTLDFKDTKEKVELNKEFLKNNLEQLYNQGLGFIIFKNIEFQQDFYPNDHLDITYLIITPNKRLENNYELNLQLCSLLWGFVEPDKEFFDAYPETKKKFNAIFYEAKKKYDYILNNIGQPYDRATKRHEGIIRESDDVHYILKRFVVKYISNKLGFDKLKDIGLIKKNIQTEYKKYSDEFNDLNYPDIIVDVDAEYFKNEAFEIETLFREGIQKLKNTIDKYENFNINKLNIVLDNITFLNHIHEIKELLIMHEHEDKDYKLEFWTLNLSENKLSNYKQVIEHLEKIQKLGLLPIFNVKRF